MRLHAAASCSARDYHSTVATDHDCLIVPLLCFLQWFSFVVWFVDILLIICVTVRVHRVSSVGKKFGGEKLDTVGQHT